MPSYHAWGPHAQHSRLPPTPPEYQGSYLTPMSAVSDQTFYPSHVYSSRHGQSSRYDGDRYHHVPGYAAQQPLSGQAARLGHVHPSQDYRLHGYSQYPYGPVAAPILPPIRVTEAIDPYPNHYPRRQPESKQKEDKPTGGVAQHLDYEMDLMSNFVAEMSQKLVAPESVPTAQFRKYVSQILSSTRLPSSTIMLGLFYLASRMKLVAERGQTMSSPGAVYRMLTTCLLLGSKFLDDNTFQNRSWAEVSSIPVQELNMMELEWLTDFDWEIHGMMYDHDDGFFIWVEHWHAYEEKAQLAKVKEMQKLAPIDTNLHRSHSVQRPPLMSPEGPIPPQYQQGSQFDTQWVRPYICEYSPPSAPHSGPTTPEYYPPSWSYGPSAASTYTPQSWNAGNASAYAAQRTQLPAYAPHASTYHSHAYPPSSWTGHGSSCGCTLCAKHPEYYFNHAGYPVQTVAG